jgi:hypothetical protein
MGSKRQGAGKSGLPLGVTTSWVDVKEQNRSPHVITVTQHEQSITTITWAKKGYREGRAIDAIPTNGIIIR